MHQLVNVKTLSALALATSMMTPSTSAAGFFQSTSVEGTIGADLGGVWLGLYYTAPTFRIRAELGEDPASSFDIGPVPEDLLPLLGESGAGVQLLEVVAPQITRGASLFVGDIITMVDGRAVDGPDAFREALAGVEKDWALLQVLRPSLKQTAANVVKIHYSAVVEEVDGTSAIAAEVIRMEILDGVLPFAEEVEKARVERRFLVPSDEQIEEVREGWFKLDPPDNAVFVGGEHRVVASESYDLSLRKDDALRGTEFAVVSQLKGNPVLGGGQTVAIYGVRSVGTDVISGTYVQSSIANAPFPISIDFVGAFRLLRLSEFSSADLEHRRMVAENEAGVEDEETWDELELEPDVPTSFDDE